MIPFLDILEMLHCLNLQLCDAKLLCLSEVKAAFGTGNQPFCKIYIYDLVCEASYFM